MKKRLEGKVIAVLMTDGFEEVEFTSPRKALLDEGAQIQVIAPSGPTVRAWDKDHWSRDYPVDLFLDEVTATDFDGLLLPGGVMNPDSLRQNAKAVNLAAAFINAGKPVAAICHAPQLLIETDLLDGRMLTSYPALKTDLRNAGAKWLDEEVVVDEGLVTSRSPADLSAFNRKMIEEFCEGQHTIGAGRIASAI